MQAFMVFRGILMYFLMTSHLICDIILSIFTVMEEMLYVCMAYQKTTYECNY